MTWPGARRTTLVIDGLGITGTAGKRVVRMGGPNCLDRSHPWLLNRAKSHPTISFMSNLQWKVVEARL